MNFFLFFCSLRRFNNFRGTFNPKHALSGAIIKARASPGVTEASAAGLSSYSIKFENKVWRQAPVLGTSGRLQRRIHLHGLILAKVLRLLFSGVWDFHPRKRRGINLNCHPLLRCFPLNWVYEEASWASPKHVVQDPHRKHQCWITHARISSKYDTHRPQESTILHRLFSPKSSIQSSIGFWKVRSLPSFHNAEYRQDNCLWELPAPLLNAYEPQRSPNLHWVIDLVMLAVSKHSDELFPPRHSQASSLSRLHSNFLFPRCQLQVLWLRTSAVSPFESSVISYLWRKHKTRRNGYRSLGLHSWLAPHTSLCHLLQHAG